MNLNFVFMQKIILILALVLFVSCQSKNSGIDYSQGEKLYRTHCSACHQADGSGLERLYPPLIQSKTVSEEKEKLIAIILQGLSGPIMIKGEEYNQVMIPHNFLSDKEIADLLSWLRKSFENSGDVIYESEVAAVRKTIN
jgi:mono/diheme cytochrome c family protein